MSAEDPTDVARLRQALASIEDDGSAPVASERIFDALHGEMNSAERQAIVEHLLASPAAAEAWRLGRELQPESAADGTQQDTARGWRRSGSWRWLPVAAALVLAVLGWQLISPRGAEEPVYRSVESRAIASAQDRDAMLSRAQPILRWSGVSGARYRVRVLTADLQLLDESAETAASEYTLSQATLERIPPGGRMFWQVEARIPGEEIIASPTFSVRVP